jgi:hypothetical protein
LQDQFKIRRKGYERLTNPQMRNFGIKYGIPKVMSDDGLVFDPQYEMDKVATKDLDPINWMEKEEMNIKKISKVVINRNLNCIGLHLNQP